LASVSVAFVAGVVDDADATGDVTRENRLVCLVRITVAPANDFFDSIGQKLPFVLYL